MKITSEQIDLLLDQYLAAPNFKKTAASQKYSSLLKALRESKEVRALLMTMGGKSVEPLLSFGMGVVLGTLIQEKEMEKLN